MPYSASDLLGRSELYAAWLLAQAVLRAGAVALARWVLAAVLDVAGLERPEPRTGGGTADAVMLAGAVVLPGRVLAGAAVLARCELAVAGRCRCRLAVYWPCSYWPCSYWPCSYWPCSYWPGRYSPVASWPVPDWLPATFCSAAMN